jgi:TetR/AcrR family transcriptional regulator, regulator of mycofactocin system
MGVRQGKKQLARNALARSALNLFSERGFEATTIEAIADGAGVSRRTFFRYYATKEDVAFPESQARLAQFRVLLQEHSVQSRGFSAVKSSCLTMAAFFMSNREERARRQKIVDQSEALRAYQTRTDAALETLIAEALTPAHPDVREVLQAKMIAAATLATIRVAMREWYDRDCSGDLLELGEFVFSRLEQGFAQRVPQRTIVTAAAFARTQGT